MEDYGFACELPSNADQVAAYVKPFTELCIAFSGALQMAKGDAEPYKLAALARPPTVDVTTLSYWDLSIVNT